MLAVTHVDKIDDDKAAEVTQPQLAGRFLRCFHVRLEGGVLDPFFAGALAGVDVNADKGFGRLDEKRSSRLQRHLFLIDQVDLLFELIS